MTKRPNDFELVSSQLTKLRNTFGADTPEGRRCSNLLEQLENLPPEGIDYLTSDTTRKTRENLLALIREQMADLAKLTSR